MAIVATVMQRFKFDVILFLQENAFCLHSFPKELKAIGTYLQAFPPTLEFKEVHKTKEPRGLCWHNYSESCGSVNHLRLHTLGSKGTWNMESKHYIL